MLPSSILMVCTGNLCRSPFAELYMRKRLIEAQQEDVACFSRGVGVPMGRKPPDVAQRVAREFGVDLSTHNAQQLLGTDLDRAGLVLVMSDRQRKHAAQLRPSSIGKLFMLSQPDGGKTIEDPIGKSEEVYRRVYQEIADHIENWIRRFGV